MGNWTRRDEEKLLNAFNGGANWDQVVHCLSGRFNATSCIAKFKQLERKEWATEDDDVLWKSRHLLPLRTSQVSERLRRPAHCIQDRLEELENSRKKTTVLYTTIDAHVDADVNAFKKPKEWTTEDDDVELENSRKKTTVLYTTIDAHVDDADVNAFKKPKDEQQNSFTENESLIKSSKKRKRMV